MSVCSICSSSSIVITPRGLQTCACTCKFSTCMELQELISRSSFVNVVVWEPMSKVCKQRQTLQQNNILWPREGHQNTFQTHPEEEKAISTTEVIQEHLSHTGTFWPRISYQICFNCLQRARLRSIAHLTGYDRRAGKSAAIIRLWKCLSRNRPIDISAFAAVLLLIKKKVDNVRYQEYECIQTDINSTLPKVIRTKRTE